MSIRYAHVIAFIRSHAWAILPSTFTTITELVSFRAGGGVLSREEIDERLAAASSGPRGGAKGGSIAVIPMYGVISQRMSLMSDISGGCSLDQFGAMFDQALNDPGVKGIVFDIDSPGGTVDGVPEMAARIRAARGTKPMVAVADTMTCSAAYWLACQADEVIATPSSMIGSIGVYTMHEDISKADEQAGIKTTLISAGKFKTEGNPFEPLSQDAQAATQQTVDDYYGLFVGDVAKGRGVSVSAVTSGYGEGRALPAKRAVAAGLADRIGTLDDAVARVASGRVATKAEYRSVTLADAGQAAFVAETDPPPIEAPEEPTEGPADAGPSDSPAGGSESSGSDGGYLEFVRARARSHSH